MLKKGAHMRSMNTLSTSTREEVEKQRLPAGAELMRATPKVVVNLGGIACVASAETGSSDADGTETTASIDPGTMDPYTFSTGERISDRMVG